MVFSQIFDEKDLDALVLYHLQQPGLQPVSSPMVCKKRRAKSTAENASYMCLHRDESCP